MSDNSERKSENSDIEGALALHRAGDLGAAKIGYQKLIAQHPDNANAMHLLGVLELQLGNAKRAVLLIQKCLAQKPDFAPGHNNLGNALKVLGDLPAATQAFLAAIKRKPTFAAAHGNLAAAYLETGHLEQSIAAARQAVEFEPTNSNFLAVLGASLGGRGEFFEAEKVLRAAIKYDPTHAHAYSNLGNLFLEQRDLDGAIAACRKAVELAPGLEVAHGNLANALRDQGRIDEALAVYRKVLEKGCDHGAIISNYLMCLHYASEISGAEIKTESQRLASSPNESECRPEIEFEQSPVPDRKLTIGYVSPDFRAHSVSWFLTSLLRVHNRSQFRILCYAEVAKPDAVTEELRDLADDWRSTVGVSDQQMAAQIRADKVDILVDLAGHTGANRLTVFARRPAPIQVSWLGYPGTTGMPEIEFRLTDAIADPEGPEGNESDFTESLIRLPNGFLNYAPPLGAPDTETPPRLRNRYISFGSFNTLAKISEPTIACWSRVLISIENSVLILKNRALADSGARERLFELFERYGVTSDRLKLHPWTATIHDHLAAYNEVDVALDTFPYNGTTTTLEALWMGVPVITLRGNHHATRVSASILERIGWPEWIADTDDDYVAKAKCVAENLDQSNMDRSGLRERVQSSPLCNSSNFAQDIEAAFREMWRTYCGSQSNN